MSAEANETLMRRFLQRLDDGNLNVLDEVFAPDCKWHMPRLVGTKPLNRDGYRAFVAGATGAMSEMVHDVHDIFAQGDKLVCRMTIRAKHTGDFMGTAPTGRPVAFGSHVIWRIEGDQVAEMWVQADFLGLMQQIGAAPETAAAS